MSDLMKQSLLGLLPPGEIWAQKPGGQLDLLYDGISENAGEVRDFLESLENIRDPRETTVLKDLEKEFGILAADTLAEQTRRDQLASKMYTRDLTGTPDDMRRALLQAGFDTLQVHENDPATDPGPFLDEVFLMQAGTDTAFAGRDDAFARRIGGELVVNGDIFRFKILYDMQASGVNAFAGNSSAVAGQFVDIEKSIIQPEVPNDPDSWPFIFFIGGDATRDGGGFLIDIARANVPIERKEELKRILLKYKPLHSWGGMVIDFT